VIGCERFQRVTLRVISREHARRPQEQRKSVLRNNLRPLKAAERFGVLLEQNRRLQLTGAYPAIFP
jgi:hypothetical protein